MFRKITDTICRFFHFMSDTEGYLDDTSDDHKFPEAPDVPPVAEAVVDLPEVDSPGRSIRLLLPGSGERGFLVEDFHVRWATSWECITRLGAIRTISQSWSCGPAALLAGCSDPEWIAPEVTEHIVSVREHRRDAAVINLTRVVGPSALLQEFMASYGNVMNAASNGATLEVVDGEQYGRLDLTGVVLSAISDTVRADRQDSNSLCVAHSMVLLAHGVTCPPA